MADITTNVNTKSSRSLFRNRTTQHITRTYKDKKITKTDNQVIVYDSARSRQDISSSFSNVFSVILLFLLLINFYKLMYAGDSFEFVGTQLFLQTLANAPTLDLSSLAQVSAWSLDVPVIGSLVNFLKDVVMTIVYIGAGLIQIISYIAYFIGAFLI